MTLNYVRCAPLIFCAAISFAASLPAVQPSTPLTAVLLPERPYSKVAVHEMGLEAARILKQSGVALRWQVGIPDKAVSGILVVVKLAGNCDMDGSPALLVPGPLGWSHEVNGTILPFSDLACDNIRGAVAAAMSAGNDLRGNILLGRAMGRVLAHELYHVVADTSQHGREGVAQAALTPRELTSGQLSLEPSDAAAVESGLAEAR